MSPQLHKNGGRRRPRLKRPARAMKIRSLDPGHRQWWMEAGFATDGTMITLRDLVFGRVPKASIEALTERQLRNLTVARLRRFPDYRLRVLGRRRPVTQRTAIQEVEAGTPLGRFLIEIERNIIRLLLERIRLGR